jgi:hypothetical protein
VEWRSPSLGCAGGRGENQGSTFARTAELDVATDLSDEVYDGFGVTLFYVGRKPTVKIVRELWKQRARNNRLRMTLAREYGYYADFLIMPPSFVFPSARERRPQRLRHNTFLGRRGIQRASVQ